MKYLKRFNESLKSDIDDILLELSDLGINVSNEMLRRGELGYDQDIHLFMIKCISIENGDFNDGLEWRDIKDCILRIKQYLGKRFVRFLYRKYDVTWYHSKYYSKSKYIELNEDTDIKEPIYMVNIIYSL